MSVLSTAAQKQVEDNLVTAGAVTADQMKQLKEKASKEGKPILALLSTEAKVTDESLTKAIAQATKVPYVNLSNARIEPEILELLPEDVAERYMAVPLGEMQNRLVVAMLDADNVQAVDFLSNKIGRPLKVYAASEAGIRQVLHQYQASLSKQMVSDMGAIGNNPDLAAVAGAVAAPGGPGAPGAPGPDGKPQQATTIKTIVQDSPISKALSTILDYAAKNGASDVHIEPLQDSLKIRCRIDGILREILRLPKSTEPPLVSRIKILANLKIDEHRIPQDGEFTVSTSGKDIDLRIAISPTVWGEQVVIRLLDKSGTSLKLEDMGYYGRALRTIREGIKGSNGMILTSGPTGSGKSTSLYALLQEVKSDAINIVTLEDPVEYKMPGINQIQVNADVGLTFASGLRSILRQDPDVVMVGEIRDKETAELAVQAALTGHLVFSTLHTNSAAGILPRLLDMGIEPFLIASTVRTVIGQRLVRRIAKDKETYESTKVEVEAIHKTLGHLLPKTKDDVEKFAADLGYETLPLAAQTAYTLTKGKDSPDAPGGYKGRMGIYEVFNISEPIQELILKHATSAEIQKAAEEQGMVTMREDGYLKALAGRTTLAEINRVATADSA
ncbi:MAG TPA: GspE/PulE family protein [Candidatus Saccharimonadales bacterium]|nr:GspE/PulE family protein [Candidatus Saccharimonadales bacterium]